MKIGVFDSGIGGKSIADSLARDFPQAEVDYVHDSAHVPYGGREQEEIVTLTENAIQPLLKGACDCIVIACNTATAAAIEYLREKYPRQKFIGLEPMIKPAVLASKTGIVAICATPFTLRSKRYIDLKRRFADTATIIEPDCSDWAKMIEHNKIDDEKIEKVITEIRTENADVIVLACTHYHWIKSKIIERAGNHVIVLDPSQAISKRVASVLSTDFVA